MEQSGPELRKYKIASVFILEKSLVLWEEDMLMQLLWRELVGLSKWGHEKT